LPPARPRPTGAWSESTACIKDRLIKKRRRKKIASYEAANEYLESQYLPEHNRPFARLAAKPEDYHGRKPTARELRPIATIVEDSREELIVGLVKTVEPCLKVVPRNVGAETNLSSCRELGLTSSGVP
jgi:hypothetical protein